MSLAAAGTRIASLDDTSQRSAVTEEEREARQIAERRRRMDERRERFLDARTRTIGVDVDALAKQIAEKEEAKKREKEEEMRYAEEQARMERALATYESKLTATRKREVAQTARSWKQQQVAATMTADYAALRDKDALKKEMPTRVGDRDTRLGAASMQVFPGEDLKGAERRALQAVQMKEWCLQIYAERAEAAALERDADMQYAQYLKQVEALRSETDAAVAEERKREIMEAAAANRRLAEERRAKAKADAEEAERLGLHEVENVLASGLLLEDPEDGVSRAQSHRKRPDHYRGMSAEERAEFHRGMMEQIAEKEAKKTEERKEELRGAAEEARFLRTAAQVEAAHARKAREEGEAYRAQLATQRADARDRAAKAKAGSNDWYVTDNFFSAFGASDR
uniref:Uncharacterized protein n=1 Tax=Bicosoecida sp. CB-2014 TaxID=1486930 RepID=A0A7S1C5K4_9STRA|mmetsp:Transcript_12635/g.44246  ORF Transcript_12635/g.44246 Transcript_12635/m.44246 type:complete len:398 (+) Transcript_12635:245-1438(+)